MPADGIIKYIFFKENFQILVLLSLRFGPKDLIDIWGNGFVLSGNKPLPKAMSIEIIVPIWPNQATLSSFTDWNLAGILQIPRPLNVWTYFKWANEASCYIRGRIKDKANHLINFMGL